MRRLDNIEVEFYRKQLAQKQKAGANTPLNVAIYARKSTEDISQASIPTQIAECKKFIRDYPDLFVLESKHIYADEGISGKNLEKRKSLQKLLNAADAKEIDVVVVYHHDRISRDVGHFKSIDKRLRKNYASLIFGNISYKRDATGRYIIRTLFSNSEFEVDTTAEKTATVLRNKASSGTSAGGRAPFGLKYVEKQFDIEKNEAPAVKMIFELTLQGKTYRQIRQELRNHGYTTRLGKDFSDSTISDILRNWKYAGIYVYCIQDKNGHQKNKSPLRILEEDQEEIRNDTTVARAIIPLKTFKRVQEILDKRSSNIPKQDAHSEYILSGLIRCQCGGNVCGEASKKNEKKYRYYVCQNRRKTNDCHMEGIFAEHLEKAVKLIVEREAKAFIAAGLLDEAAIIAYDTRLSERIKYLSKRINDLKNHNQKYVKLMLNAIPEVIEEMQLKIKNNKELIIENEKTLQRLKKRQEALQELFSEKNYTVFDFKKLLSDPNRARVLIRLFVKEIVLFEKDIQIILY